MIIHPGDSDWTAALSLCRSTSNNDSIEHLPSSHVPLRTAHRIISQATQREFNVIGRDSPLFLDIRWTILHSTHMSENGWIPIRRRGPPKASRGKDGVSIRHERNRQKILRCPLISLLSPMITHCNGYYFLEQEHSLFFLLDGTSTWPVSSKIDTARLRGLEGNDRTLSFPCSTSFLFFLSDAYLGPY